VVDLGGRLSADALLHGFVRVLDDRASVVAVGNIHGQGEVLLEELAGLGRASAARESRYRFVTARRDSAAVFAGRGFR
jgi:hypothetical protein